LGAGGGAEDRGRRRWTAPRLSYRGLLFDVTMGASPGLGDSNDPNNLEGGKGAPPSKDPRYYP